MRKIIFTRPDGGVSVVGPVREDLTEAQAEQRSWDLLPTDAINPRFADASEVLDDRTFRRAWKDNGRIVVDMPKAREIHKDRLREKRKAALEAEDVAAIDAAATPEELKAVQVEEKP